MCVLVTHFWQNVGDRRRLVMHFFNAVNTTGGHGLPAAEVPLREEVLPIHGIEVTFHRDVPARFACEPGGRAIERRQEGDTTVVRLPPLEVYFLLAGEF